MWSAQRASVRAGIRRALQWAAELEIDPESLYRRAVAMYDRLDVDRRREHPEWTWPAPPFEAVEPVTWPPLEPEVQRSVHVSSSALRARDDEPRRVARLRGILERARARGLNPEALYREATVRHVANGSELARRPATAVREGQARPTRARAMNDAIEDGRTARRASPRRTSAPRAT